MRPCDVQDQGESGDHDQLLGVVDTVTAHGYHGAEATSASSPPTMRSCLYDSNSSASFLSFFFSFSNRGRSPHTVTQPVSNPIN